METCATMRNRGWTFLLCVLGYLLTAPCPAQDPWEFMPLHGGRILGETGEDDATTILAEGFPGQSSEPSKDRWIEPIDGSGGFDNVAPRLGAEEGPGGLEWDPSPTYVTRHPDGTDYAGNSQGNNWFMRIPYATYDATNNDWIVRFDAHMVRWYDVDPVTSTVYWGRGANSRSKIKWTVGSKIELNDLSGKVYTFSAAIGYACTEIKGLGGRKITITYASGSITVKHNDGSGDVRKFTYTITDHGSGNRIDKIDVAEWTGSTWDTYRTIEFTYHEQVTNAAGSSTGDLIGIEDTRDFSESGKSYTRKWVFKYYTGTYNSSTNPGYPYQIAAVIGPGSVAAYGSSDIYTKTASQLAAYLDRTYEYHSDRRLRDLTLEESCGCGGSEGAYSYTWDTNGSVPSDLNTWYRRVNITLPTHSGTDAKLMVDYNKYGQTLNHVFQEVATNPSSRRWITTYRHDTTGRLTDSYSVAACLSYTDSTHSVTTISDKGMRFQYTYDSNSALSTVRLSKGASGSAYYQRKSAFTFKTSGDRRRYFKTSEKRYPAETTSDTGAETTTFSYTYHTGDALAAAKRTTTLPTVTTSQNGPNSGVALYDYFELGGLHTWTKDGEANVHYTGFDANLRVPTINVRALITSSPPTGVPSPPDSTFNSTGGLNITTRMEYDALGRITKSTGPLFYAYTGSSVTATNTTGRWHYSKLSGDELVVLQYPHVTDTAYYHAAVTMTVSDHDGNVITQCQGELSSAKRNTNLAEDLDESQSTIENAFAGTIIERTDSTYVGGKVTKIEVWSDADNATAAKHTTTNTYDSAGQLKTTTTPAGTITEFTYDALGRRKERKVGTAGSNMTKVEEWFYDDEETTSTKVGDGFLTRHQLYTSHLTESVHPVRTTDTDYDHRGRATVIFEPEGVEIENDYDNLGRVTETRRYDGSGTSPVLMAKTQNFHDAWGQVYETRVFGITGGSGSDYTKVETWRDKRGLVIKTLSQGKVFQKTQYDRAGRVTLRAVCYDTDETAYADADDLNGDTVIEQAEYDLDGTGGIEFVQFLQRNHDNTTGTGLLFAPSFARAVHRDLVRRAPPHGVRGELRHERRHRHDGAAERQSADLGRHRDRVRLHDQEPGRGDHGPRGDPQLEGVHGLGRPVEEPGQLRRRDTGIGNRRGPHGRAHVQLERPVAQDDREGERRRPGDRERHRRHPRFRGRRLEDHIERARREREVPGERRDRPGAVRLQRAGRAHLAEGPARHRACLRVRRPGAPHPRPGHGVRDRGRPDGEARLGNLRRARPAGRGDHLRQRCGRLRERCERGRVRVR